MLAKVGVINFTEYCARQETSSHVQQHTISQLQYEDGWFILLSSVRFYPLPGAMYQRSDQIWQILCSSAQCEAFLST